MIERLSEERCVARLLLGYFINDDHKEIVQIEYRYAPCSQRPEFEIYTRIWGHEYHFRHYHFGSVLADLLDQLPATSAIMIPHQVMILDDGVEKIVTLEEWLYPYEIRERDTIVYQLKLVMDDRCIETPKRHHGYLVTDFGSAAELLRSALNNKVQLRICYFCKYLVDYEENGGTDGRHDLLYCLRDAFRENPDALDELLKTYPTVRSRGPLVAKGTPDMDAFHSCSAFIYRETPRW